MTPQEMKSRLLEGSVDWSEDRDRPRFEVQIAGASRLETEYAPSFSVGHISGDPVRNLEWRVRGPRFQGIDWRSAQGSALPRTSFSGKFNLSSAPVDDDIVGLDEMGFEIRFHWRGKWRHELHRWPITRRPLHTKVLWDAGGPLLPSNDWDELGSPSQGASAGSPDLSGRLAD